MRLAPETHMGPPTLTGPTVERDLTLATLALESIRGSPATKKPAVALTAPVTSRSKTGLELWMPR